MSGCFQVFQGNLPLAEWLCHPGSGIDGSSSDSNENIVGTIDYIALWDRALSQEEVLGLIIPEPSSVCLLAAGGLAIGAAMRCRRRHRGVDRTGTGAGSNSRDA